MTAAGRRGRANSGRSAHRVARPPPSLTLVCLLVVLAGAAIIALTVGAAGIPLARLPAALGFWQELPSIR